MVKDVSDTLLSVLLSAVRILGAVIPNEDVVMFYIVRELPQKDQAGCLQPLAYMRCSHTFYNLCCCQVQDCSAAINVDFCL